MTKRDRLKLNALRRRVRKEKQTARIAAKILITMAVGLLNRIVVAHSSRVTAWDANTALKQIETALENL